MISYKPLQNTLLNKNVQFGQLCEAIGVRRYMFMTRVNGGQKITMDELLSICNFLQCQPGDVFELIEDSGIKANAKLNWYYISEKMKEKGISFNELAEYCRMNRDTLHKAKKRNTKVKYIIIEFIASKLECDITDILLEEDL